MTNKETILSAKDKAHSLTISLSTEFIVQGSTSGRVTVNRFYCQSCSRAKTTQKIPML